MKNQIFLVLCLLSIEATAQKVGGGCEGCEAVFEYGSKKLTRVDTLPDFKGPGPKLEISGTIYQTDGKTPAKDVILYIYHTDQKGVYPQREMKQAGLKDMAICVVG
jgi:protocatechuate 3,4-dioxygenase, beta subunit